MKKSILIIAAALLLCGGLKAQGWGFDSTPDNSFQTSLLEDLQGGSQSIYATPMPTSDLMAKNTLNTEQFASRKGWGITCIVAGGVTLVTGASLWLFGGMFNSASQQIGDMGGFGDDPEFQSGQQVAESVGNGVKTAGIVGTVIGAALVGTGIYLVSSDGGSSRGHRRSGRHGHRRSGRRRFADTMSPTIVPIEPDWKLSFNIGPTAGGLTLDF